MSKVILNFLEMNHEARKFPARTEIKDVLTTEPFWLNYAAILCKQLEISRYIGSPILLADI